MISSAIIETGINMRNEALAVLQSQANNLPCISTGTHTYRGRTIQVIRISKYVNGKQKKNEYAVHSAKGKELLAKRSSVLFINKNLNSLLIDRDKLIRLLRSDSEYIENARSRRRKTTQTKLSKLNKSGVVSEFSFTYDDWVKLQELNDRNIKNGYKHGRHIFRSKSEMLIAQLLESLGLEYKYEPCIDLCGSGRIPDFAVYCPETGRFFFIEHLGRMDMLDYRTRNIEKMSQYETAGYRTGLDIIFTMEFGEGQFDLDAVFGQISGIILAQARKNM
ncbi:MAG: hypothetical protein J5379_05715 [Clostridiales bacterium]|nr:hypothetical protein [Clostridiales bacterium]